MKIWVDADACPGAVKEILFRISRRKGIDVILVANQTLHTQGNPRVRCVQVPSGLDVADQYIVQQAQAQDLVITADIPLAAQAIEKQAKVIDPRGTLIDASNINERLSSRNFMQALRDAGLETPGPKPYSMSDRQDFANQLDRLLSHLPNVN